MKIGDVIKFKPRFGDLGLYGLVINIDKCEQFGDGGWISFDYTVMTNTGHVYRITGDCVDTVYSLDDS